LHKFYFSLKSLIILSDESSTPAFVLPSGSPTNNYQVAIEIEVVDRFGDKAALNTSVKVPVLESNEVLYTHM
jgi:hypothetical protein